MASLSAGVDPQVLQDIEDFYVKNLVISARNQSCFKGLSGRTICVERDSNEALFVTNLILPGDPVVNISTKESDLYYNPDGTLRRVRMIDPTTSYIEEGKKSLATMFNSISVRNELERIFDTVSDMTRRIYRQANDESDTHDQQSAVETAKSDITVEEDVTTSSVAEQTKPDTDEVEPEYPKVELATNPQKHIFNELTVDEETTEAEKSVSDISGADINSSDIVNPEPHMSTTRDINNDDEEVTEVEREVETPGAEEASVEEPTVEQEKSTDTPVTSYYDSFKNFFGLGRRSRLSKPLMSGSPMENQHVFHDRQKELNEMVQEVSKGMDVARYYGFTSCSKYQQVISVNLLEEVSNRMKFKRGSGDHNLYSCTKRLATDSDFLWNTLVETRAYNLCTALESYSYLMYVLEAKSNDLDATHFTASSQICEDLSNSLAAIMSYPSGPVSHMFHDVAVDPMIDLALSLISSSESSAALSEHLTDEPEVDDEVVGDVILVADLSYEDRTQLTRKQIKSLDHYFIKSERLTLLLALLYGDLRSSEPDQASIAPYIEPFTRSVVINYQEKRDYLADFWRVTFQLSEGMYFPPWAQISCNISAMDIIGYMKAMLPDMLEFDEVKKADLERILPEADISITLLRAVIGTYAMVKTEKTNWYFRGLLKQIEPVVLSSIYYASRYTDLIYYLRNP